MASLSDLNTVARKALGLTREIEAQEKRLRELKNELNGLTHQTLPTMFFSFASEDGTPLRSIKLDDGTSFTLETYISGSWPSDEGASAIAAKWMKDNNSGSLLRHSFVAEGRGDEDAAKIEKALADIAHTHTFGVHHATLKAFARHRMESGEEVPFSVLGLSTGQYVRIK
jgi:hypothetical protein